MSLSGPVRCSPRRIRLFGAHILSLFLPTYISHFFIFLSSRFLPFDALTLSSLQAAIARASTANVGDPLTLRRAYRSTDYSNADRCRGYAGEFPNDAATRKFTDVRSRMGRTVSRKVCLL